MKRQIKFREIPWGMVTVFEDGAPVFSNSEYRGAAMWAIAKYNLGDAEMAAIYKDYKEDYDKQCEGN